MTGYSRDKGLGRNRGHQRPVRGRDLGGSPVGVRLKAGVAPRGGVPGCFPRALSALALVGQPLPQFPREPHPHDAPR
jgi:hypothetical protein